MASRSLGVGKSTKWILLDNLQRLNINIVPDAKVLSIKDGVIEYVRKYLTEGKVN